MNIIEIYPIRGFGGPANHVIDLIKGLKRQGHNVYFVGTDWENLNVIDCEVYKLGFDNEQLKMGSVFALADIIRKNNVDIVHVHGGRTSWVAYIATIIARRGKVVNTWHGLRKIKNDPFHKWFYSHIPMIAVSEALKKQMVAHGATKVRAICNGIDTEKFTYRPSPLPPEVPAGAFVLGFFGRIDREKGLQYLMEAMERLENVFLLIYGDYDDKDYADAITRMAPKGKVKFCGFTTDVPGKMSTIDALVLPSIVEPFGLVICEAMSVGKPVITTNVGGQVEIIDDGVDGFIIPPESPGAIVNKVNLLMTNKKLYEQIARAGKEKVDKNFSLDVMAKKTADYFYSL